MTREGIARVAHEVNRAYCLALGDLSQPSWADAPEWQKKSAMTGVDLHLDNPDASAAASHESWLAEKVADGWVYGPVKDPATKQHPCMVPFAELPVAQQAKDYIFRAVVHAMAPSIDEFTIAPDGTGLPFLFRAGGESANFQAGDVNLSIAGAGSIRAEPGQSLSFDVAPSARPACAVRLREPHGVTPRGLTCDTCGAKSNGEPVQCKG
jgi:hypothetical protein